MGATMKKLFRILWAPIGRRLEVGRAPDGKFWCCKNEDNLEPAGGRVSQDVVTSELVCSECNRSHYVAAARAKRFGVEGAEA